MSSAHSYPTGQLPGDGYKVIDAPPYLRLGRSFGFRCLLVVVLFFYLYGIDWTFLPTYSSRFVLLAAWVSLAIGVLYTRKVRLPKAATSVAILYVLYLCWVAMGTVLGGAQDLSLAKNASLLFMHSIVGGIFFAFVLGWTGDSFRQVVRYVQVVIVIQAVFVVAYFVSWEFRTFVTLYIPARGNIDHAEVLYRSRGLTHGAGATLSVIQALGLIFTAYLISTSRLRSIEFGYLTVSFMILCLSVLLTGRTGLLALPVVLLYFTALTLCRLKLRKAVAYFSLVAPAGLVAAFLLLRYVYQQLTGGILMASGEDVFDRLVRWVVQEFSNDGQFQSRTMSILSRHWFLPDSLHVQLFGDVNTWDAYRVRSDIGIVRIWFGLGAIGLLLFYALNITIFATMLRLSNGLEQGLMVGCMGGYLLFAEMKEPFLSNVGVNSFFILLFAYMVLHHSDSHTRAGNRGRSALGLSVG